MTTAAAAAGKDPHTPALGAAATPLRERREGTTYGVLVPHFGQAATPARVLGSGELAEHAGFDAVWVRDHLLWEPHGMEGDDRTFVESLTVLAGIAARTSHIVLGTAVLIPIRWPLKLAQDLASLSFLAGGRVVAGMGLGSGQAELGAAGFRRSDRKRIFVETVEILNKVWSGDDVEHHGRLFDFEHVTIEPKPTCHLPLWYGGTTEVSVRNAVEHCEGWMPGRVPLATLRARLDLLDDLASASGKRIAKAIVPLVKVDRNRARARAGIDVAALGASSEAAKTWILPPGGLNTIDDLGGIAYAGTPDEIVEHIATLVGHGLDHVVFDFRLQDQEFERALELVGTEVLPALRKRGT